MHKNSVRGFERPVFPLTLVEGLIYTRKPFKTRDRQNFGADFKRFKSYNSPATIATELFKQSTDSASLLVLI